ncbi:hypothetical protein K3495_g1847, partial [Podosphaera aphanis]
MAAQLPSETAQRHPPSPHESTASPDVVMVDARPTNQPIQPPQHTPTDAFEPIRPQSSFAESMLKHIDAEAEKFHHRVAQAKLVLSRFCNLLDAIEDEEIRKSTEFAAAGLRDQLTNILSGRSNSQAAASRPPPAAERPKTVRTQCTVTAVPQNPGIRAQRRPTNMQPPTLPAANTPATTSTFAGTSKATASQTPTGLPQSEGPWKKVTRRKPNNTGQIQMAPQSTAEPPRAQPPPKTKKCPTPRPDERLFLRLREGHPWRAMSPHFVKLSLASKLRVATSAIEHVTVVNTGFAITAANEAARNRLLEEVHRLHREENAAEGSTEEDPKLETASKWTSVLAPNVPDYLQSLADLPDLGEPGNI